MGTHNDLVFNVDVPTPVASVQYPSHTKKSRTSKRGHAFWQGEFLYLPMWILNNIKLQLLNNKLYIPSHVSNKYWFRHVLCYMAQIMHTSMTNNRPVTHHVTSDFVAAIIFARQTFQKIKVWNPLYAQSKYVCRMRLMSRVHFLCHQPPNTYY